VDFRLQLDFRAFEPRSESAVLVRAWDGSDGAMSGYRVLAGDLAMEATPTGAVGLRGKKARLSSSDRSAPARVTSAVVARSLDRKLDAQGVGAVLRWRFEPGLKDGVPEPVVVTLELSFLLRWHECGCPPDAFRIQPILSVASGLLSPAPVSYDSGRRPAHWKGRVKQHWG
jgi:hypothetical protein